MALGVHMLQPQGVIAIDRVNVSEGGVCLRLPTMLEVRSLVRLQLTPNDGPAGRLRPVECTGRVAWVTQRLDLRNIPPYLFDIGIEFVRPRRSIHRWLTDGQPAGRGRMREHARGLEPATIHGRRYIPRLESDGARESRWHLIVSVEDVPCFSRRFPSERTALAGWMRFRRQQARGRVG